MKVSEAILQIVQAKPEGQQLRDITDRLAERHGASLEFAVVRTHLEGLIGRQLVGSKLVKGGAQRIYYPINNNDNPTDVGATQLPSTKASPSTSVGGISKGSVLGYRATRRSLLQSRRLAPSLDRRDAKLVALPVEQDKDDPLEDRCYQCFKIKQIVYCIDETNDWLCKDCARTAPNITRLNLNQSKVYLSYKRNQHVYAVNAAIAEDTGLSIQSVRNTTIKLRQKIGISINDKKGGKNLAHRFKIKNSEGREITLTEFQHRIYQALMSEECLRCINYAPKAAELSGRPMGYVAKTCARLRQQGVNIPNQEERRQNLLNYLKRRIQSEGLTSDQLKDPAFCKKLGISPLTMPLYLTMLRKQGIIISSCYGISEAIDRNLYSIPSPFSRAHIVAHLKKNYHPSSVQYALESLTAKDTIVCLNPEAKPSDRLYQPAKEVVAS